MGLFDILSRQTDTKNRFEATNFGDTNFYDANKFNYGGRPGGAQAAADEAARQASAAQNQQQGYARNSGQGWTTGMGGLANADAARAQQQEVAALQMNRARGLVPSIAEQVGQRQMQQAIAAQTSAGASGRGAAGLAMANRNVAGGIANVQSGITNQTQINAGQERLAAENAAQGAFTGIRQGDVGAANTAFGAGAQYGGLGAQYGNLGLGYAGLGHQINTTQLNAGMQQQGLLAGSHGQGQQLNSGVGQQNAQTNMGLLGGVLGLGEGIIGGAGNTSNGPEKRAMGGPVLPGQPYLVGEQGPELVVPGHAGTVIPAPQTAGLLGMSSSAGARGPSGPAGPDFGAKGGLLAGSPMGELRKHQAFGTRFARNPMEYGQ